MPRRADRCRALLVPAVPKVELKRQWVGDVAGVVADRFPRTRDVSALRPGGEYLSRFKRWPAPARAKGTWRRYDIVWRGKRVKSRCSCGCGSSKEIAFVVEIRQEYLQHATHAGRHEAAGRYASAPVDSRPGAGRNQLLSPTIAQLCSANAIAPTATGSRSPCSFHTARIWSKHLLNASTITGSKCVPDSSSMIRLAFSVS